MEKRRLANVSFREQYRWLLAFTVVFFAYLTVDEKIHSGLWRWNWLDLVQVAVTLALFLFFLWVRHSSQGGNLAIDVDEKGFDLDFWRRKHRVEWAQIARFDRQTQGQTVTTTLFDADENVILRWSYDESDTKETRAAFEALEKEIELKFANFRRQGAHH